MKFGDKLREKRNERKLSQSDVAKALGVTWRTLSNYENGASYPQDRTIYYKLADFFKVDVNYFLTEDEEFLTVAAEQFEKRGQAQARAIHEQATALFAGGELSEADQAAFIQDMQNLFLEAKQIAREKFTPNKYRKPADNGALGQGQESKG
jgi:transcriptional regulator with XRE-family HTH domain